jgi:hypothetical protein
MLAYLRKANLAWRANRARIIGYYGEERVVTRGFGVTRGLAPGFV